MGRQPVKSVEDKTRIVLVGWCGLVVCLAAGSLTAASPAAGVAGYGDVADDEYFTKPVQWSVDNDIAGIDGDCFLPDARCLAERLRFISGTWKASRLRLRIRLLT